MRRGEGCEGQHEDEEGDEMKNERERDLVRQKKRRRSEEGRKEEEEQVANGWLAGDGESIFYSVLFFKKINNLIYIFHFRN